MTNYGSFFEELKRRNVVRVGVAYLITAWLLAQVADLVLENFNAPDWIIQTILVVLLVGFPLALIFAWAYELTPEGIKLEKDVDRSQSITRETGKKLNRSIITVLVIALGYFVWESRFSGSDQPAVTEMPGYEVVQAEAEPAEDDGAETDEKSIAVLPFVNMSSDQEQEFFSDGITEEILNSLAKVKELKVAGRTSSFAFKGKNEDLREIGQALGVEHILEGSVRKSGNTVRITAQLIQVDDGFHLWSETYDRELDDVFAIQDEIAVAILKELKSALIGFEPEAAVASAARTDSKVYDLYLLARQRIYERKRLSIEAAIELLDEALTIDPEYAPAYAQRGIATLLSSDRNYGEIPVAEAAVEGRLYLDKALELDPEQAEAWAGIGLLYANSPAEGEKGIEPLQKALSINPNLIDASNWLNVIYSESGRTRESLAILEEMYQRDPLYPPGFANLVNVYNTLGMYDQSREVIERVRPFLPGDPQLMQTEANTLYRLGQVAKAQMLLEEALKSQPSDAVMNNLLVFSFMQTGQWERVLEAPQPWARSVALSVLGRREEAMIIAQEMASQGYIGRLIGEYYDLKQHSEMIEFVESRWPDLETLESEYPNGGGGYGMMLDIAAAYSALGQEEKFLDAMARVRASHDRAFEQGVVDPFLNIDEARYLIMMGDQDAALKMIALAYDNHLVIAERIDNIWFEIEVFAGDPEFEAIQSKVIERANEQRAELGLEPVSA